MLENINLQEPHFSPQYIEKNFGVPRSWVYTQIREGKLKAIRMGKYLRIPESELKRFLEAGGSHE